MAKIKASNILNLLVLLPTLIQAAAPLVKAVKATLKGKQSV
jgi:hypothetical protein